MKLLLPMVLGLVFSAGCSSVPRVNEGSPRLRVPASETGIEANGSYYIERQRDFGNGQWSFCAIDQDQSSIVINKDTNLRGGEFQRVAITGEENLAKLAQLKNLTYKMLPSLRLSAGNYKRTSEHFGKYNSYTLMDSKDTGYKVLDFWTVLPHVNEPEGIEQRVRTCDSQKAVELTEDLCNSVRPTPNDEPNFMPQGLCN